AIFSSCCANIGCWGRSIRGLCIGCFVYSLRFLWKEIGCWKQIIVMVDNLLCCPGCTDQPAIIGYGKELARFPIIHKYCGVIKGEALRWITSKLDLLIFCAWLCCFDQKIATMRNLRISNTGTLVKLQYNTQ